METPEHYETQRYEQFRQDLEEAGYEVEHYQGRWFYQGPAVRIDSDELQDIIRLTDVKVQWDELGKDGLIVYPR